jgi:poly(3-hydroxybutyrate) depolymerase
MSFHYHCQNLPNIRIGLFCAALLASLTAAGFAQTTVTLNFPVAGQARTCAVRVPDGTNNPAVVFFLHGAGGNGPGFANDTKGYATADREKFIAAYPSGVGGNWSYSDGSNDFTYLLALIDTIDVRYHIDRSRVYVTGFSMGGGMTFALACGYADVFAAIAPVSAAGTACTPKRAIPVFLTFGTKDMSPVATYMASVSRWADFNKCASTPVVTRPYPSTNPQSNVTRLTYGPGTDGVEVVADSVQGGGHAWPTDTRTSVNQADEVWAFFKKFSLKGVTSVRPLAWSVSRGPVFAVYSPGFVRIRGIGENIRAKVFDAQGRLIAAARHSSFTLMTGGVYIVTMGGRERPVALRMVIP